MNTCNSLTSIKAINAPTKDPSCVTTPHQSRARRPSPRRMVATLTFTYEKTPVSSTADDTWKDKVSSFRPSSSKSEAPNILSSSDLPIDIGRKSRDLDGADSQEGSR